MKKQYPYSNDKDFLRKISSLQIQEQWVNITLLEYNSEIPLKNIEGVVTSGTLNKDGNSSVRRSCNLTCVVDSFKNTIEQIKNDYSISKKIYLELGITNSTNEYQEEKIIWFPQGVFFISSFSISANAAGSITINLQFKDKMAQLDGTIGGILPATTRFDTITTTTDGFTLTKKTLVYDIIMEAVNHFGNEDICNIIIDDIPRQAKRIIRWMGSESLWIYPIQDSQTQKISYDVCLTSDLDEKIGAIIPVIDTDQKVIGAKEYKTNQDIGYMYEDFVYDKELTFGAGSKVTDVLDQIKNWLGNYEYFYDEYGQFHFQEIKNYLNNSYSTSIWNKINTEAKDIDYLYESTYGKNVYFFDNNTNLISITNTPSYENIKNDFIVEGTVTNNNIKSTCRYHLVIDDKPTITIEGYDNVLMYTDPLTGNTTLTKPEIINGSLPEFAEDDKIYGLLDRNTNFIFKQPLRNMNNFEEYYNRFVNEENGYINNDILNNDIQIELFDLLQRYMSYNDDTFYKEIYIDIIFTLARQLQRYNISNKITPLNSTKQYYEELLTQFNADKDDYGDSLGWCGGLLKILYDLFSGLSAAPDNNYVDENYWPSVKTNLKGLWYQLSSNANNSLKKNRCLQYIENIKVKQKQLEILIGLYSQIINEYNKKTNSEEIITDIQNQINNYKNEQNTCEERLTILYATFTALGGTSGSVPILDIGETYYTIDVSFNVDTTSFWYFEKDKNQSNYGWNEIQWYQYYGENNSMTYIDYSAIDWEKVGYTLRKPSMNISSNWYKTDYRLWAEEKHLPFHEDNTYKYIPTNWRTELFLRGLRAEENGIDTGYYYQELKANLPTIYDFKNDKLLASRINYTNYYVGGVAVIADGRSVFLDNNNISSGEILPNNETDENQKSTASFNTEHGAEIENLALEFENGSYHYYFDMIDSSSPTWGKYSVKNIGRRTNVNVNDGVNCIFASKIPDYAFVNVSNLTQEEYIKKLSNLKNIAEDVIQVTDNIYQYFATGISRQSAYEQIKYDLQQHTLYQNTINITAIPCFYLEPNVRVNINDTFTNIFGDYIVKSISIPLGVGGNMSVNLSEAMEKL